MKNSVNNPTVLTEQKLNEIENFKRKNGCDDVYVASQGERRVIFPIHNHVQKIFVSNLFEKGFDLGIHSPYIDILFGVLETKSSNMNELSELLDDATNYINN